MTEVSGKIKFTHGTCVKKFMCDPLCEYHGSAHVITSFWLASAVIVAISLSGSAKCSNELLDSTISKVGKLAVNVTPGGPVVANLGYGS